ncbi:MAG: ATP synthase subunit I [Lautropia sp.]|nr:ATP synthase subunit I [Lautropia sp.]MCL4701234.1 ATP synthase subunit I [Burkholderiaceae bacterium]MDL1906220.1 ATP synthase subunit I [Betaproteobacteria bacterium PRO1]MEB2336762.1 ATP synthase subunit I [Burkholderiales bacterium]
MLAAVGLQIAAVAVLALVAGVTTGWESARFLLLGGAVAIVPNALFALRLALHRKRTPESYPVVFFLGEFAKIGLTAGLLAWIVKSVPDIRWLPLLIGLIVALKAPLFALAFVRSLPGAKGQSLRS